MRELILESLKCHKIQDWFGADECRLEIVVDGALVDSSKKRLRAGQEWELAKTYQFLDHVKVKLWDEDYPGRDDHLGTITIDNDLRDHRTALFTEASAHYRLRYSVIDAPGIPTNLSEEAISAFSQSDKPGVWDYITKTELLADIQATIDDPYKVRQESLPLCGPAAIVFELVSRDPARYVRICQELYETGAFHARTKTVQPSYALIHSRLHSDISVADWMLMATLRDAENILFPVEANLPSLAMNIAGITTPWEMKSWAFEILNFDNVKFTSTYLFGDVEAIRKAHTVTEAGGVAFLLIDMAMLGYRSSIPYPNHWVSYLGDLEVAESVRGQRSGGLIHFNCYSWGPTHQVHADEGLFQRCMWGVVTGEP